MNCGCRRCLCRLPERVLLLLLIIPALIDSITVSVVSVVIIVLIEVVSEGELLAEVFFLVPFGFSNKFMVVFHLVHG